ncbi:hypothetical protein [Microlunatus soli]|uniref:Uncharacterized protein n=1 Tax=Microlunatus soli TaxID=630515 RepID=A0A1H1SUC9_9ACTN|nr:hypothetical protein [Microlunatus soli]SDS51468.1 hypothetical protein SAMN04489812_2140 [Microlunatus soli]
MNEQSPGRLARYSSIALLIIAAVAFAAYPMLRGSGSEVGLAGARLYARPAWLLAHLLGMIGFVTMAVGLGRQDRLAGRLALTGAILVLPYYGAEAFGLHALGLVALATGDPGMIAAADTFRYHPAAITVFAAGLLLLAGCGVRLLIMIRRPGSMPVRVGLVVTGVALIGYLPQFFTPIEFRIGHGILLGVGLVLLAVAALRRTDTASRPSSRTPGPERR